MCVCKNGLLNEDATISQAQPSSAKLYTACAQKSDVSSGNWIASCKDSCSSHLSKKCRMQEPCVPHVEVIVEPVRSLPRVAYLPKSI